MKNKCAIYARYSTDNQDKVSIDDQIDACKKYASDHGMEVLEAHIFSDEKVSGTIGDRKGYNALKRAASTGSFNTLLVFMLDRLSRKVSDGMGMVEELEFEGINVISISQGIQTNDYSTKMCLPIFFHSAEMYAETVRIHTKKSHDSLLKNGFIIGTLPYGFETERGTKSVDGITREGAIPKRIEPEIQIIKRIFQQWIDGRSLKKIASDLNGDSVPSRTKEGWNTGEISRILKNEIYRGIYIYGKTKSKRNPSIKKKVVIDLPPEEWFRRPEELLRAVEDDVWYLAQDRLDQVSNNFKSYKRKGGGFIGNHKSYTDTSPEYLLSGSLKCGVCGAAMVEASGKDGGYYQCRKYSEKRCDNVRMVKRTFLEGKLLAQIMQEVLTPRAINLLIEETAKSLREAYKDIPDRLNAKRLELSDTQKAIENLNKVLMKHGDLTSTVEKLKETEKRAAVMKAEIRELEIASQAIPQAPDMDWIESKLNSLNNLLEQKTEKSALALRELFGEIVLTPHKNDKGKTYLVANTNFSPIALLRGGPSDNSSISSKAWRWRESNPRPRSVNSSFLHV